MFHKIIKRSSKWIRFKPLCYNNLYNISNTGSDTLPQQMKFTRIQRTSLSTVVSIVICLQAIKLLIAENEELRRQLDKNKPKSSEFTCAALCMRQ